MKRNILAIIAMVTIVFSCISCETYTYATTQDDIYSETSVDIVRSNVDFNIVIRMGTPYYYDGSLLYYFYNGLYYYPYYYNNYWYVRAYRRPFPYVHYRPYFRPHRYDYHFDRGYRPQHNWYRPTRPDRPFGNGRVIPNRPHDNGRVIPNRPHDNGRVIPNRPHDNGRVIPNRPHDNGRVTPQTRPNNSTSRPSTRSVTPQGRGRLGGPKPGTAGGAKHGTFSRPSSGSRVITGGRRR